MALHFALGRHTTIRHGTTLKKFRRRDGYIKVFMVGFVVNIYDALLASKGKLSAVLRKREGFIKNVMLEVILKNRGGGVH